MIQDTLIRNDIPRKDHYLFIALLFVPIIFINRSLNGDVWFLLNSGRYVLEKGIPLFEPFTLHHGFSFLLQQWLSAVLFWLVYDAWGKAGLLILVAIFYGLLIFSIFRLNLIVSRQYYFVSFSVTMLTSVIMVMFMTTRPYVFSTLLFVEEMIIFEKYAATKQKRLLLFLPVLSAILINLHAAMWPMQFVLMLPLLIDAFGYQHWRIQKVNYPPLPLLLSALLMLAAGLANPYGFGAMTYLIRSYGHEEISSRVSEMKVPDINTLTGKLIFGIILLTFLIFIFYRQGKFKLRYVLLNLGLTYLVLSSIRSFLIYLALGLFPLAHYFSQLELPAPANKPAGETAKTQKRTLVMRQTIIAMILLLLVFSVFRLSDYEDKAETSNRQLSTIVQTIVNDSETAPVTVYTGYNDGGYVEFLGLKPYIDARAEVFLIENNSQQDVMKEYVDLQSGKLHYQTFLNRYHFTHLIVTHADILFTYLALDDNFELAYTTQDYYLFKRVA
jgi:hypothetical protein